jgi:hypothetical protein
MNVGYMFDLNAIISSVLVLAGVAITLIGQLVTAHKQRQFDLEMARIKLGHDASEKRQWLVRERLEKLHLIVGEIGREFSLTFLTIDREAGIRHTDYHEKYRKLCAKVEEAQMIADLYMQEVSESLEKLDGEMNMYWGNFSQVLYLTERGEKIDHTTRCFDEAFKYSRSIPGTVANVQDEIRSQAKLIMSRCV